MSTIKATPKYDFTRPSVPLSVHTALPSIKCCNDTSQKYTMIDHILGRPSQKLKSLQVLFVLIGWTTYLLRGNRHGPYFLRRLSRKTSQKLTTWQVFCMTLTGLYLLKNTDKLLGLGGTPVKSIESVAER